MSRRDAKATKNTADRVQVLQHYEQQKIMKPGMCNKFLHAVIDPEFLQDGHGAHVLSKLGELSLKYEIKNQLLPRVITFYRSVNQQLTSHGTMTDKHVDQKFIVHLMEAEELVIRVKEKKLISVIQTLQDLYPGKTISLLVFGLLNYCRNNRGCVGRRETEVALTEIQVFHRCSYQLLETAEEVANFVAQLGKSLAELPYKQQQYDKYSQEQSYLGNEKKGCVRVEGTAGLQQLYQNQLTKIPSVTLEVAEAIINVYPSLSSLINAFRFASDGPNLLADIPIRRAGGPITASIRRIGPELSKKIHLIYSATDPKLEL
ncbi:crossover junction endonuclease EME1 [Toxorhynchites rutilus septentrionalis]|uniref:crossover junction endonuclease EME1 n=1 Tax=Toxorhynchites rutilus septentrionalis TaxID=329112 RepID=UPI002479E1E2|nr:crossover junction endonuclease EME1 [Toxorhynchites rutilus septentrionalis]